MFTLYVIERYMCIYILKRSESPRHRKSENIAKQMQVLREIYSLISVLHITKI